MNPLEELKQVIAAHASDWDCLQECYGALTSGSVVRNYTHNISVQDALGTYQGRAWTTRRAGLATCGFERTIRNLASRRPDEVLIGDALNTADKLFVLFRSLSTGELIGCIRVTDRTKVPNIEQDAD